MGTVALLAILLLAGGAGGRSSSSNDAAPAPPPPPPPNPARGTDLANSFVQWFDDLTKAATAYEQSQKKP
jgi:hypothetical protein